MLPERFFERSDALYRRAPRKMAEKTICKFFCGAVLPLRRKEGAAGGPEASRRAAVRLNTKLICQGACAPRSLSPEKQARITNAALEVFARNDYKHASTDDIAAKAGISKGLLFYYFRNKQSLYLYLYDYALEQVRGQVLRQKLDGVTDFFELMHIGARAKLELLTRCPYLLEFSIRAFYSRGEAISDAVQARLNGDLTGSFAQYFSNIDFSKFRPGVDPAQLLRMLTWMTEGYMNEKQRAGVPLRLEDILADYSGWEEMFRKIAYKEEYL